MKVNIYLTKEQSTELNAISYKYEVSKSTIAEKVLFYLTKYLIQEQKKEIIQKIGTTYLYNEDKGEKTSIKIKENPTNKGLYENNTKAYTNALVIYVKKDFKNYVEETKKLCSDINKALQTTKEQNWDYNRFIRSMHRYKKRRKNANSNI